MEIFYHELQKMKRVKARKKLIETYKKTNSIRKEEEVFWQEDWGQEWRKMIPTS